MNKKSDILTQAGRRSGMTVPDGYFAEFAAKMASSLPATAPAVDADETSAPSMTTWRRLRPYVYMAAMFAGIWCMMKMFNMLGNRGADLSIDNYPGVVTALNNDSFVDQYVIPDINEYDIIDQMIDSGIDFDDLMEWEPDTSAQTLQQSEFN